MKRHKSNFFGNAEAWIIPKIVRVMPQWVSPDMMTLLSILGAGLTSFGLVFTNGSVWCPVLVVSGLFLNWFGDCTDGALARIRDRERPIIGFWIDRVADTICFVMIFLALGISPYVDQTASYVLTGAFLFYQVSSLNLARISRVALIGFMGVGATEARTIIALGTLLHFILEAFGLTTELQTARTVGYLSWLASTGMILAGLNLLCHVAKRGLRNKP